MGRRAGGSRERATKVLIVDDIEDNRRIYTMFLRRQGFDVAAAVDGPDALAKAVALSPDVIVMDLAIPRIDGWEATRRLKGDVRTRATPVIALTGYVLGAAREAARQAGCDAFLTKPCLPDDLVREIRRVLRRSARRRVKR